MGVGRGTHTSFPSHRVSAMKKPTGSIFDIHISNDTWASAGTILRAGGEDMPSFNMNVQFHKASKGLHLMPIHQGGILEGVIIPQHTPR